MDENKTIAVILDGMVIEVVKFNERFASLLLSNPTFVDISSNNIDQGWIYENNKFTKMIDGEQIIVELEE